MAAAVAELQERLEKAEKLADPALFERCEELSTKLQASAAKVAIKENMLEQATAKAEALDAALSEIKAAGKHKDACVQALRKRVLVFKDQNAANLSAFSATRSRLELLVAETQSEVCDAAVSAQNAKIELSRRRKDHLKVGFSLTQRGKELAAVREHNEALESRLEAATTQSQKLRELAVGYVHKIDEYARALRDVTDERDEGRRRCVDLNKVVASRDEQISVLETRLAEAKAELEESQNSLEGLGEEVKKLNAENSALHGELAAHKVAYGEMVNKMDAARDQIAQSQAQVAHANDLLVKKDEIIAQLQARVLEIAAATSGQSREERRTDKLASSRGEMNGDVPPQDTTTSLAKAHRAAPRTPEVVSKAATRPPRIMRSAVKPAVGKGASPAPSTDSRATPVSPATPAHPPARGRRSAKKSLRQVGESPGARISSLPEGDEEGEMQQESKAITEESDQQMEQQQLEQQQLESDDVKQDGTKVQGPDTASEKASADIAVNEAKTPSPPRPASKQTKAAMSKKLASDVAEEPAAAAAAQLPVRRSQRTLHKSAMADDVDAETAEAAEIAEASEPAEATEKAEPAPTTEADDTAKAAETAKAAAPTPSPSLPPTLNQQTPVARPPSRVGPATHKRAKLAAAEARANSPAPPAAHKRPLAQLRVTDNADGWPKIPSEAIKARQPAPKRAAKRAKLAPVSMDMFSDMVDAKNFRAPALKGPKK